MIRTASVDAPVPDASTTKQARACQVCAISKAKCVPQPGSEIGKCQRWKDGLNYQGSLYSGAPDEQGLAQLEKKLDSLVSLLTVTPRQASLGVDADVASQLSPKRVTEPLTHQPIDSEARSCIDVSVTDFVPSPPQLTYLGRQASNSTVLTSSLTLPADDQLRYFQNNMVPYFPFVVIPEGMTAESLHTSKPFLYDNIMMVTSFSKVSKQSKMRSAIIASFAEQFFIRGNKSLDLLQGTIVFAAWYHHCLCASPQLTNMIQSATALVFDLGLHKAQSQFSGQDLSTDGFKSLRGVPAQLPRTSEERRAFLGLFCLSKGLSVNIGKIEPLQNTSYVEECCAELERQQEYESDLYLVFQVRFLNLTDAPIRSFQSHSMKYWKQSKTDAIYMLVKSFERNLEQFKKALNPELLRNPLLQIHLSSISIHNTKIALRPSPPSESTQSTPNPERLALLITCLRNVQTFFTEWLSLPPVLYHHLPISTFTLVAHNIIVLGTLNLFECDGWDVDYVQKIASFSSTMDKLAQKYEEAGRGTDNGENSGYSSFWKGGIKMKRLVDWYEAKRKRLGLHEDERNVSMGLLPELPAEHPAMEFDFDILNEQFWNEDVTWMRFDEGI
ncbi:hypothetical protein BX600DRAFT_444439 [Xylariales sp. PMI_506]|nr:hypothetical protein BX600DRAFT_444439 [Xylariales sp. PMI_506]